jgi:hypothetical protein
MFERQPEATAPIRELRFAPSPAEALPFQLRFFLTAEEEFTDNADQTKDNRRSEFRTRIVPGIAVRADRPSVNFNLSYAPEIFIPNNSIDETELNQNLSLRLGLWPTGKFQLNIADDFTDSNDFRDVQDPGTRRTGTEPFLRNVATAEAAYVLPRLRTALAYTNILNQEEQPTFTDTRISHIVRPNMLYTDPRFSLAGSFELTRGNENSSVETPFWRYQGDARYLHVLTQTASAGVTGYYQYQENDSGRHGTLGRGRAVGTFALGPDGTLLAEAGADTLTLQDASTEVRPSVLVDYTHRFFAFAVTVRYEQGYLNRTLDVSDEGVTFTRSAGIFVRSSYFRNLSTTVGLRYGENTFETAVPGIPVGTTDRTWSVDAEMRYSIMRSLFLTLGYNGTFRISTQETEEFNENRVRLGLTYEYNLF